LIVLLLAAGLGLGGCASPAQQAFESGRSKGEHGDADGALAEFTRATQMDPQFSKAYREKGAVLRKKGILDAAIADYDRALALDPGDASAYEGRADARGEKSDWDGALLDYSRALELDAKRPASYLGRAYAKHMKGDFDGSIADLTRCLDLDPGNFKATYNRATSKQSKRDWDGAIADLSRALDIDPNAGTVYDRRGQAKQSKGDLDGALLDFTRAIDLDPSDAEAWCHRGVAKIAKKDWEGAIAGFTQALSIDAESGCLYSNRGFARLQSGDWEGAAQDFKRAIELEPRNAKNFAGLASVRVAKGDLSGAKADLTRALELEGPGDDPAERNSIQKALDALKELAARINDEVLSWTSVREKLSDLKPGEITPELLHAKRRELVESILIRQYAERKQLTVSDSEVDEAAQRDRKLYPSAEEFEKFINVRYGSRSEHRKTLHWNLLRGKAVSHALATQSTDPEVKDALFSPAAAPQEELRRYFDAHPDQFQKAVEEIAFLRIGVGFAGPQMETDKTAILESLLRRLEKGSEFAMLAYFYSTVPRAKGFRDRGVTRADLQGAYAPETIAFLFDTLREGETSGILKDGKTLNIFKMEQKVKHPAESFEDAEPKIRSMLEVEVRNRNYAALVQALRRSARIEPVDVFQEK
jgi:tetratricopeptide (TPR) repeat protein